MSRSLLEMRGIGKRFPGVRALSEVHFAVEAGEIHALVGENGAGKSTLMKILSGVHGHGSYEGEILLDGLEQRFRGVQDSERAGIAIIYQELALVPELSVHENILLGHELRRGWRIDWNESIRRARELLDRVGLKVNPAARVKDLGIGQRQLVEIAKALSRDVRLLILDEPTAALNEDDSDNLLALLDGLRRDAVTCVLITHKLKEVLRIADRVTVLRDGRTVCTLDARREELSAASLIRPMVGRELDDIYPKRGHTRSAEVVLEVAGWQVSEPGGRTVLTDIAFTLRKGEIVGLAGLMGSGRTELARSLFGNPDHYRLRGELKLKGVVRHLRNPRAAIRAGLAYASEDRKGNGLILLQDVKQNLTLANLRSLVRGGVVDRNAEIQAAERARIALNIKTPSLEQLVVNLSGGNQQKVSIGKWLFVEPAILILDEPTCGIDVGAKHEIYTLMNRLVEQGMSILMISSELPEVLGMSDRVYVLCAGRITGELAIAGATQENIMQLATGC